MLLLFNTTRTTSGPAQLLHGAQNGALVAQRHKSMVRTPNSTLSKQVTVSTHSVIEYRVRCSTKTHETCHMTRKLYELFEPEKRPYSQLGRRWGF